MTSAGRFEANGRFVSKKRRFKRVFYDKNPSKKRTVMKCRQMLWCTAIYTNLSCEPSARLSNPGSASSVWAGLCRDTQSPSYPVSHVNAKTRNNYMPRFVFYRKKRLLFAKKPFLFQKNENALCEIMKVCLIVNL
jgi:hypothetical protein